MKLIIKYTLRQIKIIPLQNENKMGHFEKHITLVVFYD